jgi:hypothetical protein
MKDDKKVYEENVAQVRIYAYPNMKVKKGNGEIIGFCKVDMSGFVNQNMKKYTVKMDLNKAERNIYLTMRLSVFDTSDDFHKLALQRLKQQQEEDQKVYYISTQNGTESDDEQEMDGEILKENFDHLYRAFVDKESNEMEAHLNINKDSTYEKFKEQEKLAKFKASL